MAKYIYSLCTALSDGSPEISYYLSLLLSVYGTDPTNDIIFCQSHSLVRIMVIVNSTSLLGIKF